MRVFTYLVWVSIERIQSHSPSIRFCAVWLGGMYNVILLLTHSSANRKNKHRPTKNMFSLNCIAVCVWKSSRDENIYVSISSFARHANVHAQMNLSLQFLGRIQNRQFKSNYEMRISTSNKLMKQFAKDWNREREREEKKMVIAIWIGWKYRMELWTNEVFVCIIRTNVQYVCLHMHTVQFY